MRELPLLRRFPALAKLPRATIGVYPTPVQRIVTGDGRALLVKRDDLAGTLIGGNKVRALEWLLGDVRRRERILTVGPRGSTHALITATYAQQLGGTVTVVRWNQEMNPAAARVARRLEESARVIDAQWPPTAYVVATAFRIGGARWIPAGGATPLAVLGHVNAALELAEQIDRGECELPKTLIVPLGTGGTAAGLALGLKLAGIGTRLVAVRVVPRVLGRVRRVLHLANAAAALIERVAGVRVARVERSDVRLEHAFYAGGYGRPLPAPTATEPALLALGVTLDDTYSRKAFAAASAQTDHPTLFWLTFDGRILD